VRDNQADPGTPLWITEAAVSSDATEGVGGERQGGELVRLYRSIEGHEVESFIIHRLHDVATEPPYWNHTGVVAQDLEPKPSYCELGWGIGQTVCPAPIAVDDEATVSSAPPAIAAALPGAATLSDDSVKAKRGRISLEIACDQGEDCEGTAEVQSAKRVSVGAMAAKKSIVTLAKPAAFSIPAGESDTVRAKLTGKGKKLLKQKRKVKAEVSITTEGPGEDHTTTGPLTLKLKKKT
jgi:hypothetical protein